MHSKGIVLTLAGIGCLAAAVGAAYWAPRHEAPAPISTPLASAAPAQSTPRPVPATHATAAPAPAVSKTTPAVSVASRSDAARTPPEVAEAAAPSIDETPRAASIEPATVASTASVEPPAISTAATTLPTSAPPAGEMPPPAFDPQPVVQPPARDAITIKEDAVIGIRLDQTITTETARVEDRVTARVTRDVRVDGRTAIPEGATLEGNVTLVERGGRFHDNARLGVKFTTLVLDEHTRVPLVTDTIYRVGESASNEATAKIGASAVVGAILGAVVGGKRGAAIGGSAGAASGAAAVAAGGPNDAVLAAGMPLTVRLSQAVTFDIDRN